MNESLGKIPKKKTNKIKEWNFTFCRYHSWVVVSIFFYSGMAVISTSCSLFFHTILFPFGKQTQRHTHRVLREGESKSRCLGVVCYEPAWRQATPPLHRSILDYELHKLWSKFEASPWVLKKKKKWQENGESLRGGGNASAAKENWKDFSCCYSVRESHTQHNFTSFTLAPSWRGKQRLSKSHKRQGKWTCSWWLEFQSVDSCWTRHSLEWETPLKRKTQKPAMRYNDSWRETGGSGGPRLNNIYLGGWSVWFAF